MRTEAEIRIRLGGLEAQADAYEDMYEENFEAIRTVRWILDMPDIAYEGRGPRADSEEED